MIKETVRLLKDIFDRLLITRHRNTEIKKFKEPLREKIWSSITLSDDQTDAVDKLYLENYGQKIPYTWHRHFTAYTGQFAVDYFPEMLFIPEFEHFMNPYKDFAKVLEDKNLFSFIAKGAEVKTCETLLSSTRGAYKNQSGELVSLEQAVEIFGCIGEVFVKPTINSNSGRGCFVAVMEDGTDKKSGKSAELLMREMGADFAVQKRLRCHSSIADIYGESVNTFRVITYRWKNEIKRMPIIMRIGSGGRCLDNAHAGGMFIAVDDDGTLHRAAFTEFKTEYTRHPDSNLIFEGYKIKGFRKVIDAAERLHQSVPQIGCINWDLTLDQDGEAVVIEANVNGGSVWLPQMAHGKGPFGEHTAEVLRWMKLMKSLPASKRGKHYFGNMGE